MGLIDREAGHEIACYIFRFLDSRTDYTDRVCVNPQNTRGRRAIRFRELNNRLRQKVYGGDLKKKK